MKYLCINCKKEFQKIPPLKLNECQYGHRHRIVKKTAIMSNDKRVRLSNKNQSLEDETE